MSLRSQEVPPIPEQTARVVHAACPQGTLAMQLRDHLGVVYDDASFAPLFAPVASRRKHPGAWLC
jgi:transposase